jgi:hypothetical protein
MDLAKLQWATTARYEANTEVWARVEGDSR